MASGCSFLKIDESVALIGQEQGIPDAVSSFLFEIKVSFAQYWSVPSLNKNRERMGEAKAPLAIQCQSISFFTAHPAGG